MSGCDASGALCGGCQRDAVLREVFAAVRTARPDAREEDPDGGQPPLIECDTAGYTVVLDDWSGCRPGCWTVRVVDSGTPAAPAEPVHERIIAHAGDTTAQVPAEVAAAFLDVVARVESGDLPLRRTPVKTRAESEDS